MSDACDLGMIAAASAVERELQTPACRRDRLRLESLLADDFVEVGSSGAVYDRDSILALLEREAGEGDSTPEIEIHELTGRIVGPELVMLEWVSHRGGVSARRTSLWRLASVGWQIVHHQGTPLAST